MSRFLHELYKILIRLVRSIFDAVDFLLPASKGQADWQYPELEFCDIAAADMVHADADAGDRKAKEALDDIESSPRGDLWDLRPAVEQLDAIGTR